MNERIRELVLQAGFSKTYEPDRLQKFAELLVKECAQVCNNDSISSPYYTNKILNHFGLPNDTSTATRPRGWV